MRSDLNIVYFSCIDWNSSWQRPQQLAIRLSRLGRMLYINPLGMRSVQPKDLLRVWNRLLFQFRSGQESLSDSRLTIRNPLFYIPFPGSHTANRMNTKVFSRIVKNWMKRFGVVDPIVWVGVPSPAVLETVQSIRSRALIYDCMDNFALFHNADNRIAHAEAEIVSRAQFVLATANVLHKRMKALNTSTFLVPNAADFDHFSQAADRSLPLPQDIAGLPKPIIGYYGELAQWFDFDLIERLARENPHWSLVFIGKMHTKAGRKIFKLSNVHFLGPKTYQELPAYLSCFDVCLLPFKVNELTSAVNPVKLYEYLSAGKPVVSTPLDEVLPLADIVEIAASSGFSRSVAKALETQADPGKIAKRQEFARSNTWDKRIEEILRILD